MNKNFFYKKKLISSNTTLQNRNHYLNITLYQYNSTILCIPPSLSVVKKWEFKLMSMISGYLLFLLSYSYLESSWHSVILHIWFGFIDDHMVISYGYFIFTSAWIVLLIIYDPQNRQPAWKYIRQGMEHHGPVEGC